MSGLATHVLDAISTHRVLPVVVVDDASDAAPLGDALVAGGLPIAEVTFRTAAAEDALRTLAGRGDLLVGAGTVLRPDQVARAAEAGAQFIVSPGLSRAVVEACRSRGLPVLPGVSTATEIMAALELGVDVVKFFPAESCGGAAAVRALAAPFPGLRFVPTGGIGPAQLAGYLAEPAVLAVGGSWMVGKPLIARRDFAEVSRLSAGAVAIAHAKGSDRAH